MKRLKQDFNLDDDSISYAVIGESDTWYRVDSSGYLTKNGLDYGRFKLGNDQWHLYLDSLGLYMSGPPNGLFKLPEFELKALTALVNDDAR